jgi:hypothetical protein
MKADFSTTDLIHLQVASRLSDLLFEELQKLNIADAPLSALMARVSLEGRA